jgi:hypothetical protein
MRCKTIGWDFLHGLRCADPGLDQVLPRRRRETVNWCVLSKKSCQTTALFRCPETKPDHVTAKTGEKQSASGLIPDGFHAVTVETGVTSDEYVEITSGDLSEGDTVYITQSTVTTNEDINMPGMNGGPDGGFGGAPGGNFSGNRSGSGAPSGGPMRN